MARLNEFFATHPVFTVEDLDQALGRTRVRTRRNLLSYHRQQGRILPIRRGLYASVPAGSSPEAYAADPYLVASRLTPDAVIGYHSALEIHGVAYSAHTRVTYLTRTRTAGGAFAWRGMEFQQVQQPRALLRSGHELFGTQEVDRAGLPVRVTTLERTLVDVLARPDLAGGWEELWRSLESIEYLQLDEVIEYALLLDNATTAAKVGYFLERRGATLGVTEDDLRRLEGHAPKSPHYLERGDRTGGKLIARWNLVVPEDVLGRAWEEWS
jgi:predicted transcriptional regulator of viral defense system